MSSLVKSLSYLLYETMYFMYVYMFLRCNRSRERRSKWRGWRQWVLWCHGGGSWVYHCSCRASLPQVSAPSPPVHRHCTNTLAKTLPNKEVNFETMNFSIAFYLTLFTNLHLDGNILARKCVDEIKNLAQKHVFFPPYVLQKIQQQRQWL